MATINDNYNDNNSTAVRNPQVGYGLYIVGNVVDLKPLQSWPEGRFQYPIPLAKPKEIVALVFDTRDVVVSAHKTILGALKFIQENDPFGEKKWAYECFEVKE